MRVLCESHLVVNCAVEVEVVAHSATLVQGFSYELHNLSATSSAGVALRTKHGLSQFECQVIERVVNAPQFMIARTNDAG